MKGGKSQRRHKTDKKMNKTQENCVAEFADQNDDGDDEEATAEEANTTASHNALLQGLTAVLSKELKDFKQDMRLDLGEFKNDVKKNMKEDFTEFKDGVMRELQSQNANIAEAQTRIADLESACLEMKDALLTVVKQNTGMRDKLVDLESRSRRNNLRIYGVPEDKEGRSVAEFVSELFKSHLALPEGAELQIQRAHRAPVPKPAATATPRSIIVNFLQFHIKELIIQKAWQQRIELDGKRLYFDNDYAADIMERRKAYGPVKAALKEKGIRYQTPYTKIRVHWDSGLRIYESAEDAARDLNQRGVKVTVTARMNTGRIIEERLNELLPWKRTNATGGAAQRARERLTEYMRSPQS